MALHKSLAAKVHADPSVPCVVKERLSWLRGRNPAGSPYYDRWLELLAQKLTLVSAPETVLKLALQRIQQS